MKRLFLFFGITIFAAGATWALNAAAQDRQTKKLYHVTLTFEDWVKYVNYLEYTKNQLKQTDLPAKQVSFMTDSLLGPLQAVISQQVGQQAAADQKRDSTGRPKQAPR